MEKNISKMIISFSFIIFGFITIISLIVCFSKYSKDKEIVPEEIESNVTELDINSSEVIDLYKKIPVNRIINNNDINNSVYKKNKQSFKDLSKEFIIYNVLYNIDSNSLIKNNNYYSLNTDIVKEKFEYLFGDVNFDVSSYFNDNIVFNNYCFSSLDDNNIYFSNCNMNSTNDVNVFSKLVSASLVEEYIYLYNYAITSICDDDVCYLYTSSDSKYETKEKVYDFESCKNVIEENNLIKYMHTFKKDSNNNYYWVSTEKVK